ncbi:hypothetical protein [Evansella cellulosilytica]|uniref:Uncharacterized protein n=1 Tax=Evansella cellulosilytica (strain ATCC 21833 / DSM 2522 / FERM P-1141 / JCM 9156 / N-4) TaxID=649639 RepID=E6TUW7_EVAC2|nr:hypothetical protein [Evansella cellulosilytica]ADU32119.1 hypothetical protein Bcell_3880 [Evansella cellulosilytica DSM 2522]
MSDWWDIRPDGSGGYYAYAPISMTPLVVFAIIIYFYANYIDAPLREATDQVLVMYFSFVRGYFILFILLFIVGLIVWKKVSNNFIRIPMNLVTYFSFFILCSYVFSWGLVNMNTYELPATMDYPIFYAIFFAIYLIVVHVVLALIWIFIGKDWMEDVAEDRDYEKNEKKRKRKFQKKMGRKTGFSAIIYNSYKRKKNNITEERVQYGNSWFLERRKDGILIQRKKIN